MGLKAVKPEAKEKRLKLLVYGPAGVGKTTAAIQFPNAYIVDTERGTDHYAKTINKSGSVVLQSNNPDEIRDELQQLLTKKHPYKTLIIDPITQVYNSCQEKWTRIFEKYAKTTKEAEIQDFGPRYWGRVKQDMKAIDRLLLSLDMNVLITSHQKDIYGPGMQKVGVGPDTKKGDEYLFDLVFELKNLGGKRMAITTKERAEMGESRFPPEFEWSYDSFLNYYGSDVIQRASKPLALATPEQVIELTTLLGVVKVEEETINKWLTKAEVDKFADMKEDQILGCIAYCKNTLAKLQKKEPMPQTKNSKEAANAVLV